MDRPTIRKTAAPNKLINTKAGGNLSASFCILQVVHAQRTLPHGNLPGQSDILRLRLVLISLLFGNSQ
jgi:hypothetical protein